MTRYIAKIEVVIRADSKEDADRIADEFFEAIHKEVPDEMLSIGLLPATEYFPELPSCCKDGGGGCVIP